MQNEDQAIKIERMKEVVRNIPRQMNYYQNKLESTTKIGQIEITTLKSEGMSVTSSVEFNQTIVSKQPAPLHLSQSSLISHTITDPLSQQKSEEATSLRRGKFIREINRKKLTVLKLSRKQQDDTQSE